MNNGKNMNDIRIPRATGLLVIEVCNSNPNGDPDQESDPRRRSHDNRGIITGVSFKRKLRDLVLNKEGEVWKHLGKGLQSEEFDILEWRDRKLPEIGKLKRDAFNRKYWDGRVFGNTLPELIKGKKEKESEESRHFIRTGVAHFGNATSVAPVRVERHTLTNVSSVEIRKGGKSPSRGMAPLGYRVVEHGVYCMPFFINPTAAIETGCQARDIALLLKLIRYAYAHTKSAIRPWVEVRYVWYAEHADDLGSFSEFEFIGAMTPKRKGDDPEKPSTGQPARLEDQYDVPRSEDFKGKMKESKVYDLCIELPPWCERLLTKKGDKDAPG